MLTQDQDQPPKRICIGKITAPHGVKGLVKILPFCEDASLLEHASEHEITLKNSSGKYILAEVKGCNSREEAEKLAGCELTVTRSALPAIEEDGEYYIEDLIGLTCVDTDGTKIGAVKAVHNFGAGDLLEIQPLSGKTFLLPFTDEYAPEIGEALIIQNYESFME
ncbi:MAG: 16S rRNA processing protein RimM [Alphaproteobacteria bacterium]|nr:16S rRNA processing protein RimM [Alphaproteobacteria bacterium]